MENIIRERFADIHSGDKDLRYEAYNKIMEITKNKVDWAYEVWEDLKKDLKDSNNHLRSIAAQVLCNLSKSDPENRILQDLSQLLILTKDERFVTARHCLQSLWVIALVGVKQKELVISAFEERYLECQKEKNCTLIRADIIQNLRNIDEILDDESIKAKAIELIALEEDLKYKKKYLGIWKNKKSKTNE